MSMVTNAKKTLQALRVVFVVLHLELIGHQIVLLVVTSSISCSHGPTSGIPNHLATIFGISTDSPGHLCVTSKSTPGLLLALQVALLPRACSSFSSGHSSGTLLV